MADESMADFLANIKPHDFKTVDAEIIPEEPITPEPPVEPSAEIPPGPEEPPVDPIEPPAEEPVKIDPPPPNGHMKDPDWRELIKTVELDDVLKEAGLDEFEIDLIKYRKQTGELTPYLEAKAVDYTKMPDEEIMKRDLKRQYGGLSEDKFEVLYRSKITTAYNQNSEDEEEQQLGQILLEADANRVRQSFIEEQKKFAIPVITNTSAADELKRQTELAEVQTKWVDTVGKDAATTQLLQSKKIALGDAKTPFNYEVENPEEIQNAATEPQKFWELFNKDGQTDLAKYYRVVAYAKDPAKFEKALINHGESLGRKAETDALKNPSAPNLGGTPVKTFKDEKEGILNAFLTGAK